MEFINSIIGKLFGFDHAVVLMYLVAFNMLLSGLYKGLEHIKDKTESNLDNKIYDIVGKIIKVLLKVLDYAGYNIEHKK